MRKPAIGLAQHLLRRAPRTLKVTREGRVVIGLAFFAGFAAINTGNNLVFLGWGLVLSGIVLSGVLSEATLRPLSFEVSPPPSARAQQDCAIGLTVINTSRRALFGVEIHLSLQGPNGEETTSSPVLMRIEPRGEHRRVLRLHPLHRGAYRVTQIAVQTRFPFGFFVKTRPVKCDGPPFWVAPAKVPVHLPHRASLSRHGGPGARNRGVGEDYFELREFRSGDDLRRVRWRLAGRSQRWLVVETEALEGKEFVLELYLAPTTSTTRAESAISITASLAELLLEQGFNVGLRVSDLALPSRAGERQRVEILFALARIRVEEVVATSPSQGPGSRIAIAAAGVNAPQDAHIVDEANAATRLSCSA